jgi:hypothetical protein
VDASQNVGIGTASPTTASSRRGLVLRGNANGAELIVQSTSATDGTSDGFSITTVGTDAYLFNRLNGFTAFATNNTERMRVNAGAPILCLSGGNTSATGTGIAFPATQSASSDANTLDDYEEGTFTPVLVPSSGAVTTQSGAGTYVKVGKLVTLYYRVTLTTVGTAAGTMTMTNFPFASTSGGGSDVIASGIIRENGATGFSYQMIIQPSTTNASLFTLSTNGAAPFTNGYVYTGSLSYVTA